MPWKFQRWKQASDLNLLAQTFRRCGARMLQNDLFTLIAVQIDASSRKENTISVTSMFKAGEILGHGKQKVGMTPLTVARHRRASALSQ
jgi:hypothetical protein